MSEQKEEEEPMFMQWEKLESITKLSEILLLLHALTDGFFLTSLNAGAKLKLRFRGHKFSGAGKKQLNLASEIH